MMDEGQSILYEQNMGGDISILDNEGSVMWLGT